MPDPLTIFATALIVLGLAPRVWAIKTFHAAGFTGWHLIQQPPYWVGNGPYRFMRHPMYRAGLMLTAGVGALLFGHLGGVRFCWPWFTLYRERELREEALRTEAIRARLERADMGLGVKDPSIDEFRVRLDAARRAANG